MHFGAVPNKKTGLLSSPAINLKPTYYLKIPKNHRLRVSQLTALYNLEQLF
jgi:hypothetical protein